MRLVGQQTRRLLRLALRAGEIASVVQRDGEVEPRQPEPRVGAQGAPERLRGGRVVELLEQRDAEVVRAVRILARGRGRGRPAQSRHRGGHHRQRTRRHRTRPLPSSTTTV
jgi:hypothetical protein